MEPVSICILFKRQREARGVRGARETRGATRRRGGRRGEERERWGLGGWERVEM